MLAAPAIPASADSDLADRLRRLLALDVRLGPVLLFGRGPFVVVRLVVPTAPLLAVQRAVVALAGRPPVAPFAHQFDPGGWVPHVTLARRVPGSQVPDALAVLAAYGQLDDPARLEGARRWDGNRREVTRLV